VNAFDSGILDQATAQLLNGGPHATVVVDAVGRIRGCGATAEVLFQASQSQLIGCRISACVVGILFDGNSPGDEVRQLLRHCAAGCWEKFQAIDTTGRIFPLEVHVMRRMSGEHEVFVLNLRHLNDA
jgi:hypothetical protein